MDQATGHMQAEAQKPQNQKNHENCPKHISLPLPPRSSHSARAVSQILSRIALLRKLSCQGASPLLPPNRSEQYRPARVFGLSEDKAGDEHFFSLFQVL
jgi:hypothetical protein